MRDVRRPGEDDLRWLRRVRLLRRSVLALALGVGHAEACARVERDVAATAAVRAAHDVDALAWWRVAVVHVDEGLATACDALGECHGVGAFRRECGCFRRVPFGSLPARAEAAAADDDDDALEVLQKHTRTPLRPKKSTVRPFPARSWLEMYARLGFARTSRAALVFSAAATTVAFCEKKNFPF